MRRHSLNNAEGLIPGGIMTSARRVFRFYVGFLSIIVGGSYVALLSVSTVLDNIN